jgi:hypothetical protein
MASMHRRLQDTASSYAGGGSTSEASGDGYAYSGEGGEAESLSVGQSAGNGFGESAASIGEDVTESSGQGTSYAEGAPFIATSDTAAGAANFDATNTARASGRGGFISPLTRGGGGKGGKGKGSKKGTAVDNEGDQEDAVTYDGYGYGAGFGVNYGEATGSGEGLAYDEGTVEVDNADVRSGGESTGSGYTSVGGSGPTGGSGGGRGFSQGGGRGSAIGGVGGSDFDFTSTGTTTSDGGGSGVVGSP